MSEQARGELESADQSPWFWGVIEQAAHSRETLASILQTFSAAEIIRFKKDFADAAVELTDGPYWEHLEDTSEDQAQDVADWVVSQGKHFYLEVLRNPQKTAEVDIDRGTTYAGVADNVFWERFNRSIPFHEESE